MYFKNFPTILYDYGVDKDGNPINVVATDITQNIRIRKQVLSNVTLYDEYDIKEGETVEMIAEKFYGDPNYHWVVMLANERFDPIGDFPLTQTTLVQYVKDVYGEANVYATHHYENEKGFIVDAGTVGASAISNLQYEEIQNEKKRRIKLISNDLLSKLLTQFKDII